MLVTDAGIVTLSRLEQSMKALLPMVVTPEGIVTLSRLVHPLKASIAISVTELGMLTSLSAAQPLQIAILIKVTPLGIVMLSIPLVANAASPISVTVPGISMLLRLLQPSKA